MSLPRQLLIAHPTPSALPAPIRGSISSLSSSFSRASPRPVSVSRAACLSPAAYRATWHRSPPRTFSSSSPTAYASSKRPLVTSASPSASTTAPKPSTSADLDAISTPPPRNADAPAVPGVHDVRPPAGHPPRPAVHLEQHQHSEPMMAPSPLQPSQPTQTSSTQAATGTAAASAAPDAAAEKKTRPKSKLRPLRAALQLTPAAVAHIKQLLDQPQPKLLRIGTRRRGCSGLAYHLEYVDKADRFDEVVTQDGVDVLVEGRALLTVLGSTMDWVDEKLGSRFVFTNPNIKEQCGCGESFMV